MSTVPHKHLILPVPILDEEKKFVFLLTLKDPFISESFEIKIELNFYFHTSLWCHKRFYEGLKGLHKTFWGTTKKCENKNLTYFFLFVRDWDRFAILKLTKEIQNYSWKFWLLQVSWNFFIKVVSVLLLKSGYKLYDKGKCNEIKAKGCNITIAIFPWWKKFFYNLTKLWEINRALLRTLRE